MLLDSTHWTFKWFYGDLIFCFTVSRSYFCFPKRADCHSIQIPLNDTRNCLIVEADVMRRRERKMFYSVHANSIYCQNKWIPGQLQYVCMCVWACVCFVLNPCFSAPETGSATLATWGKHRKCKLRASNSSLTPLMEREPKREQWAAHTSFTKKTQMFKLEGWSHTDG